VKTYEYIFAAVILVAILLAATFLTGISPPPYRSISEIEQLKMAAQKVMVQILLSPGYPEDWGGDINIGASNLSSFGLAVSTVFTREVFVLDPDKVQRLNKDMPDELYIPPEKFSELLGLGSIDAGLDYGVRIEFIPALKVTIGFNESSNAVEVKVESEHGMPISGANVLLGVFCVGNDGINFYKERGQTGLDGKCIIYLNFNYSNPSFLVAIADYNDLRVMNTTNRNSHISYLIGNYLLVKSNIELINMNATQVFAILSDMGPEFRSVSCSISEGNLSMVNYKVYNMSYVESNIIAVAALAADGRLIVAYKNIPGSYSSVAGEVYAPLAYMLERSVRIGISSYTIRLRIWRMSW